eukprot:CAMPEP_0182909046 /NCGR_PEP_ID=MMETSP0034_2-20130328/35543_1 /TAXON_ID=156128 /ORGANISM="Nephroselmis pyriformis, Strain CCMP717" /LENGTH=310 /DNA_ID=CAMNT_0025045271 /DNA_START=1 /DNA_END=930 /DNA_ORIENTATION=+
MADPERMSLGTRCIHAGHPPDPSGAVVQPIYQSAVYHMPAAKGGRRKDYTEVRYARLNNSPNHTALAAKISSLEGSEAAVVAASGMAAISTTIMALLRPGDHVLAQETLYGGTIAFLDKVARPFGVEVTYVDMSGGEEAWEAAVTDRTKMFYVESISNPLCQVTDLAAVASFAAHRAASGKARCLVVCDNTFGTPINLRPVEAGLCDLVVHSCTKYYAGHSDVTAGCVAGSKELVGKVSECLANLGGTLDPHACFLLDRGIKTLALRVRQQNSNAQAVAEHLKKHRGVEAVYYPGLQTFSSSKGDGAAGG